VRIVLVRECIVAAYLFKVVEDRSERLARVEFL